MTTEPTTDPRETEIAALRARVAELEDQLARKDAETAQLVATAQEKLYWLERWHIDLDKLMRKPGAIPLLDALRSARALSWKARKLKRRVLGPR
ncbi:hypothetical protein [Baekduia sp. Peel2402]|uniref:hypothetical protein n=1 Tax=Baekduia sp. Peel2402 TaxID=3458296 RepID=UPI00403E52F8